MEKQTFIEPELIKAGDSRVRLGYWQEAPKVDVRVISEDNYQLLKQAYDKLCALAVTTPTSDKQLAAPAVSKSKGIEREVLLLAYGKFLSKECRLISPDMENHKLYITKFLSQQ